MLTIHKYPMDLDDHEVVFMPRGAKIAKIGVQRGKICVWALVDTDMPETEHHFYIRGTGHPAPDGKPHVGTVEQGDFVWHIFSLVPLTTQNKE